MTKSKAAFLHSVERLFDQKRRVYFWTFTFPRVVEDDLAFKCWNHLGTLLRRRWADSVGVPGLRVVEVHAGGHGLHFHLLVARRLAVQEVRRLAIRAGFGRIHVMKARRNHADYMAKYLAKAQDGLARGRRRWGCFGSFKGTRVKDIVIESTLTENIKRVREVLGTWGRDLFLQVYRLTAQYGHCLDWPTFPELKPKPRPQVSDNDCPSHSPQHPEWMRIRVYCQELAQYVSHYVPVPYSQPF